MSLESKLDTLNASIVALIAALQTNPPNTAAAQNFQAVAQPPATVIPPQAPAAPTFTPPTAAPAAMPPGPSFAPPPVQAAPGAPFSDTAGLVKYAMDAYGALGADKGAGIQTIIGQLGKANINDLTPDQFPHFYAAVEALKAS